MPTWTYGYYEYRLFGERGAATAARREADRAVTRRMATLQSPAGLGLDGYTTAFDTERFT